MVPNAQRVMPFERIWLSQIVWLFLFGAIGCAPPANPTDFMVGEFRLDSVKEGRSLVRDVNHPLTRSVELGIVLAECGGQFLFPLSTWNLTGDEIESIESSCHCVTAEVIQLAGIKAGSPLGVLLIQVGNEGSSANNADNSDRAQSLSVKLTILERGADATTLQVNFVSAYRLRSS